MPTTSAIKPRLVTCRYAGFWRQGALTVEEFIARAGKLGFASVMMAGKRPHLSPLDATPERLEQIRAALQQARLTCDVIAAYTNLASGSATEVPQAEMQIAYI